MGAGGSKNMVPNSPSFAPLSSPLLKAGAEGAVHECGRGNAPPLQSFAILHTPPGDFAKIALPQAIRKTHKIVGGAMPRPY